MAEVDAYRVTCDGYVYTVTCLACLMECQGRSTSPTSAMRQAHRTCTQEARLLSLKEAARRADKAGGGGR